MQKFWAKADEYTSQIEKLTAEYDRIAGEQKERIMTLRDQNRVLSKKLEQAEQNEQAICNALVRAERASCAIIENAKKRAEQIVHDARIQEEASYSQLQTHKEALQDLSVRCDRIAKAIAHELSHSSNTFLFELPSKITGTEG